MKGIFVSFLFCIITVASCESKKENKTPVTRDSLATDTTAMTNEMPVNSAYSGVDISPMDMCYYPADYPKLKMTKSITSPPLARVIYSRPHLQRRQLFQGILQYGQPWRMGANEATELQLFRPARIQDKTIAAGRYSLYCIPQSDKWTIVINSNIDTWGLQQDSAMDVARFDTPVNQLPWRLEYFSMVFEKTATGAELLIAWDNIETRLPFRFE